MASIPAADGRAAGTAVKQKFGPTVVEYLTAYGVAVIAPMLIFAGLLLHRYISVENAQLEQRALQTVQALRAEIDRELTSTIVTLEALASSPALDSGDYSAFHKHASSIVRLRPDQRIVLRNAVGHKLADTQAPWPASHAAASGAAASPIIAHNRSDFAFVSDLDPSQDAFTVTVPVSSDKENPRWLSVIVAASRLAVLLGSPRVAEGWHARIFDRRGQVVASSDGSAARVGWLEPSATLRELGSTEGTAQVIDGAGRQVVVAYTRSGVADWLIAAGVMPDLVRPPLWSWRLFAVGGGSLLALSCLLALYFGRRLAKPIRLTALAASAFGRGEAMPPLAMRLREIDEVLSALKTASVQRRMAEDQLRMAHERMTLALSATDMGMWERNLATNKVVWSDAMYRIFGRTREEFTGDPDEVLSFVHEDDRAHFRKVHEDATRGVADTFEHEARIVRPSGEVRWVYRRAYVRRNALGNAESVLGVAIDITERKEAEKANAQLAAIVASSSEAILSVAPDGTIATWNDGAEQMFGLRSGEAVGLSLQTLFSENRRADWHRVLAAMQAGETIRLETICLARDHRLIEVSMIANPVRPASQSVARYSVTMRDISERKEHDRHLASVMRELTHRSKNLLAIIQAMARQTALRSHSLPDFEQRFSGRLQCLSRSHELLIGNDWEGAQLGELIAVQRSTLGSRHSRIRASGPDVFLRPEAILNIGLALHELASNAERHGALSTQAGRVELSWSVHQGDSGLPRLTLTWREFGRQSAGDLLNRGFGRDILEHVVPTALGGHVVLKAIPDGLLWSIDIPGEHFALSRRLAGAA